MDIRVSREFRVSSVDRDPSTRIPSPAALDPITILGPPIPPRDKQNGVDKKKVQWPKGVRVRWVSVTVPFAALLTMGNGIWSLVLGISEYMTTDAIVGPFPPFETGAGVIIIILSLSMIIVFSSAAKSRFAVLVVGCLNTILPPLILAIMSAIITYQYRDVETGKMTTSLCGAITDPYTNVTTSAWDEICNKNSNDLVANLFLSSWIRTGFQVLFSALIGWWTGETYMELNRDEKDGSDLRRPRLPIRLDRDPTPEEMGV